MHVDAGTSNLKGTPQTRGFPSFQDGVRAKFATGVSWPEEDVTQNKGRNHIRKVVVGQPSG